MVCLELEPGAAGESVQTNPLSYGGTPNVYKLFHLSAILFHKSIGFLYFILY